MCSLHPLAPTLCPQLGAKMESSPFYLGPSAKLLGAREGEGRSRAKDSTPEPYLGFEEGRGGPGQRTQPLNPTWAVMKWWPFPAVPRRCFAHSLRNSIITKTPSLLLLLLCSC